MSVQAIAGTTGSIRGETGQVYLVGSDREYDLVGRNIRDGMFVILSLEGG